jgi:hypothetical protein
MRPTGWAENKLGQFLSLEFVAEFLNFQKRFPNADADLRNYLDQRLLAIEGIPRCHHFPTGALDAQQGSLERLSRYMKTGGRKWPPMLSLKVWVVIPATVYPELAASRLVRNDPVLWTLARISVPIRD